MMLRAIRRVVQQPTLSRAVWTRTPTLLNVSSVPTFRYFSTATEQSNTTGATEETVAPTDPYLLPDEDEWVSAATREVSYSTKKNVRVSPRKMNELCRMIRGLSVEEAKIQLALSQKRYAHHLIKCVHNAMMSGQNTFFMDKSRMIVKYATCTKAKYGKKLHIHARGRASVQNVYHAHLRVGVVEQAWEKGEVRIGKYPSRRISSIEHTMKRMKELKEEREAIEAFTESLKQ